MTVHAYLFRQSDDIDPCDYGQYRMFKLNLTDNYPEPNPAFQKRQHAPKHPAKLVTRVFVLKDTKSSLMLKFYSDGEDVVLLTTNGAVRRVVRGRIKCYRETCPVSDIFEIHIDECEDFEVARPLHVRGLSREDFALYAPQEQRDSTPEDENEHETDKE